MKTFSVTFIDSEGTTLSRRVVEVVNFNDAITAALGQVMCDLGKHRKMMDFDREIKSVLVELHK